jgi:hypothetical protein
MDRLKYLSYNIYQLIGGLLGLALKVSLMIWQTSHMTRTKEIFDACSKNNRSCSLSLVKP